MLVIYSVGSLDWSKVDDLTSNVSLLVMFNIISLVQPTTLPLSDWVELGLKYIRVDWTSLFNCLIRSNVQQHQILVLDQCLWSLYHE